ncbi:hypothetical protein Sinac_7272 [Singulisphaera acidiphila DSM 18658]|uniref:Uncharacterized protein n=1 Tax=Singulisphaera acidiphila (strain ATCC BAA-1392 / DSM 18658 / VKM B-2454 / MOB10) TaxID=886293 RepID=L0DPL4_SINAD|nr:hypothetical protein Sinac_7272 [Singulisphaera acidiphila DSM 18658]
MMNSLEPIVRGKPHTVNSKACSISNLCPIPWMRAGLDLDREHTQGGRPDSIDFPFPDSGRL